MWMKEVTGNMHKGDTLPEMRTILEENFLKTTKANDTCQTRKTKLIWRNSAPNVFSSSLKPTKPKLTNLKVKSKKPG
jgi:hypothetical protein